MLFKMQEDFYNGGFHSIKVVPINSYFMRHIQILETGLKQLYQREAGLRLNNMRPPAQRDGIRECWSNLFEVEKFETGDAKFPSISTNGIAVSVLMERPKRVTAKMTQPIMGKKYPGADYILVLDPGYRMAVGGVRRTCD